MPKVSSEATMQKIGGWAFILGAILSIILGVVIVPPQAWMMALLAILGLVVALLNVTDKEVTGYLIANIAVLIGASQFNTMLVALATPLKLGGIATTLQTITSNLVFFVAPGAVVIALKEIYNLARSQ